ncbi:MAG: ribose-phosphate diphosphokinase [Burkholderiaceae bacterium]
MADRQINQGIPSDNLALFALKGSDEFGQSIARHLGLPLALHEEREFADGEHKSRPMENVRNKDVYIVHSLHSDARQSCNDKLCRMLFFIGAVKDAGASRITAVVPYLAYARKDQKSQPRDPTTSRYVAQMFEACGTDAVLAMDVHNRAAFQNAFRCHTDHLEARRLFVDFFRAEFSHHDIVVVSPDAGGIKRAELFRRALEEALSKPVGSAFSEKYRSHGIVSGGRLIGEVGAMLAIIFDDLISTGTTIVRTARACKENGAVKVVAAATHGAFSGDADAVLADPALDQIIVCDTVLAAMRVHDDAVRSKLTVLVSSAFFAEAILRMHTGGSVTDLLH